MSQIASAPSSTSTPRPPVAAPVLSGRLAVGTAVGWTLVAVVSAVVALVTKGETQAWVEGTGDDSRGFFILAGLGAAESILMVAAWIAGSIWLLGLRAVAEVVAPGHPHRRSQIWAVAGWAVPILHLWFPLQVVADALSAVGSRSRRLLLAWWTTWLLASVVGYAASHLGGDLMTAGQVSQWVTGLTVDAVLTLLALPAWVVLVRRATRAAAVAGGGATVEP
ncbi:MAG: DUF4328 domain-containing protein [Janibacter sp.]|nr:DUF4328 domain-containing protein [Janibacter sp.]